MNAEQETEPCDVAVIGAGPAGMAAAATVAGFGLRTVLVDDQPLPGGQIYRAVTRAGAALGRVLGRDYVHGRSLVDALERSGAEHRADTSVWSVDRQLRVWTSAHGRARVLQARRVIIATGAQERPMPIPGWTLPGVMTVGAAQILLKASALVAERPTVLAGTGPLLWLLAAQYLRGGAPPPVILDVGSGRDMWRALARHPDFLASPYLAKGLALMGAVRRRCRVVGGVTALRAEGEARLQRIRWQDAAGQWHGMETSTLLLHQGVVPGTSLARAAGCDFRWDSGQHCWHPVLDAWGQSSLPGIAVAGDGGGISGARAAEEQGRLAGIDAAHRLGRLGAADRDRHATKPRAALLAARRGRAFLDAAFAPPAWLRRPEAGTTVCRCEEVTAGDIAQAAAIGCSGPNQLKAFLRCGMGPCQGRQCALTVTELLAAAHGTAPAAIGDYRLRAPVRPVRLAEIASLPRSGAEMEAVERK